MCGILVALGLVGDKELLRRLLLKQSHLLRHRGPDNDSCWQNADGSACFCFNRLHVIDPSDTGM